MWSRGSSLASKWGGPGAREQRWRAWRHGGNGASVSREEGMTGGVPLSGMSSFSFFPEF